MSIKWLIIMMKKVLYFSRKAKRVWLFGKYDYFWCDNYEWEHKFIFKLIFKIFVFPFFEKNDSSDREYYFQVSVAEEPRDIITWARHQMRSPAITFHTIRPSGQKIYLILFIKNDLTIVLINEKHNRAADKISDFLYNEIFFSILNF